MYGRDTKSESLEFMGREEGTVSLMQEHGADYVAADRMKGSGVAAARNQFYVHLVTCAHQRLSQIQTLDQRLVSQCEIKYVAIQLRISGTSQLLQVRSARPKQSSGFICAQESGHRAN